MFLEYYVALKQDAYALFRRCGKPPNWDMRRSVLYAELARDEVWGREGGGRDARSEVEPAAVVGDADFAIG
jgi:hypothetical protein